MLCRLCNSIIPVDRSGRFGRGVKYCSDICMKKFRNDKYHAKVKAKAMLGMCASCGNVPATNGKFCLRCLEVNRAQNTKYRERIRKEVVAGLGGICAECGITDWRFLVVDHINAGGLKHRKELKTGTMMFFLSVRKENFPRDKYQVLCFNCNLIKLDKLKDGSNSRSKIVINYDGRKCGWCSKIPAIKGGLCDSCYLKNLEQVKRQALKLKQGIVGAYGGKCKCCSESRLYALTIDHINGDGKADRSKFKSPSIFYRWLRNNNYPKDKYQLLCMNCNMGKYFYDICPHQLNKSK